MSNLEAEQFLVDAITHLNDRYFAGYGTDADIDALGLLQNALHSLWASWYQS